MSDDKSQLIMNMFERDLGAYPLSIGTSLAIETIAGINKEKPLPRGVTPPIRVYESMFISLRMIMRNIHASITDRTIANELPEADFYDAVMMEMKYLREVVAIHNPTMTIGFYGLTYKELHKRYPLANIKPQRSEGTRKYADLEVSVLRRLYADPNAPIIKKDYLENISVGLRTIIWTNSPLDLITLNNPIVTLLESHTGTLKDRSKWNSKYTGKKDFSNIPFNRSLLQIFGDGGYLFSPKLAFKNRIIRIAAKNNWTSVTAMGTILEDVKREGEEDLFDFLQATRKR